MWFNEGTKGPGLDGCKAAVAVGRCSKEPNTNGWLFFSSLRNMYVQPRHVYLFIMRIPMGLCVCGKSKSEIVVLMTRVFSYRRNCRASSSAPYVGLL